ncbi:MAG: flagellar biosynthesis protein FliQ [Planctomycetota bacterium]
MLIDQLIDATRSTLLLMLMLSLPVLGAALVIGLVVSILQAVTQVQEQTLSFVPKIVCMVLVAVLTMPWMVAKVLEFSSEMFGPWLAG